MTDDTQPRKCCEKCWKYNGDDDGLRAGFYECRDEYCTCHAPSSGWEQILDNTSVLAGLTGGRRVWLKSFIRETLASEIAKTKAAIKDKLNLVEEDDAESYGYNQGISAALRAVDEA